MQPAAFAVAPLITATKSDAFPDPDNDGKAVPGDTITYTVQITNSGTDATGVVFSDTVDANTTSNGTFTTTPIAVDDSYSALGNVDINVPAASGLTANDSDPDGGAVTAVAGTSTSTNGGNVSVNADGSFTYNPPPGFEGADTFTYTINGASAPSNTATVTVNVAGMIWFVNAAAGSGGDGRLSSPFNSLTGPGSFDSVAADQPNDNIFLYSGAYLGGLSLLSGQALIGAGSTASLATVTGLTPPSYSSPLPATGGSNPMIGGASGISIATNNLIRGVTIQNTGGTGISGSAFGTLAVADTAVDSTTGPALNLDNGLLQASFQSLSSTGSAAPGISLSNIAVGSLFSGGTTTVNSRGATGIELNLVQGVIGFGATTIPNPNATGGYGIRVRNSGAAVTFDSATITDSHLTIAQSDANNDLIPETDGDGDAIFLSNNTGSFAVNGGVLSNCGNDCVDARSSSNVSLANVGISFPGVDVTNASASGTGGSGIQGINLSGTNSLTSVNVQNFNKTGRDGMRLINNAAAAMTMTVGLSLFADSTATNGNGIVISGRDNANMALVVQNNSTFQNLFGPAIAHRAGDNANSTATVNLTVQNSTFQNAQPLGQNTVQASVTQAGKATILADTNTFNNVARTAADTSGVIDINGNGTLAGNSLSFTATNNTITNIGSNTPGSCGALPCTSRRGIDVFLADSTSVSGTIIIDGNQITDVKRSGIAFDISNVYTGSNVAAKITNNTVGTNALRVGTGTALSAGGEIGVNIQNRNNSGKSLNLNFSGNTVRNGNGGAGSALNTPGVFIRDQNSSSLDATLGANNIETNTSSVVAELRVDTSNAGSTLCLDVNGNTLAGGASGLIAINETAGALNVEQASAAAVTAANNGAAVTTSGTPQFNVTCANPPLAMFRTNTRTGDLAALDGPAAKAAQGFAFMPGARSNFLSEMMPGLDTLRSNWKQELGALSYRNAAESSSLNSYLSDAAVRPARETTPETLAYAPAAAAPMPFSGETITVNIGTLPAGKSITITFQATINNSINTTQVSNQGTVSGTNFGSVQTDDPDTGALGDATVTPVGSPATISCPANITANTDPGQYSASVAFSVTSGGSPAPTVDCKIGATSITSPHTFPVGTTTVQCTATNGIGSPASCSFNVTVNDNQTPAISCPADITANTAPNSCDATVSVGTPTVSDNDPNVTVGGTRSDSQPLNAPYPKGTTTITWTATDTANNSASCQQTVTVNDATAPVVTLNGAASVTVECHTSFTDPGATANDSCDGTRPVSTSGSVNVNAVGNYTLTYSATDTSGNTGSTTRVVHVVDTTAPVVTLNGSTPVTVVQGGVFVDPGATANDSCGGPLPVSVSGSVNTAVIGTYILTYSATDASGNTGTKTRTVFVVYGFTGFFSPVSNPPVLNEVKAGQNVPLKFSLNGYKGLAIFAPGYPASQQVNCVDNVPINVLEETDTPGGSTLTYDAGSDRYQYNWKTEKSWAGTCRVLVIVLTDGSTHTANFKFK
ncbi:MAG: PxKF domain-containing protein [Pyrinomonadaceae bacterium]